MSHLKITRVFALRMAGMALVLLLLFSFVSAQYARAVGIHKMLAPLSLEVRHPVKRLVKARYFRGDMVNSFQKSHFSVTVLCPQELGMLIRQIARGIHLSGIITGFLRILIAIWTLRNSYRSASVSVLVGATTCGCAAAAPEYIRALSIWSLGYAPF